MAVDTLGCGTYEVYIKTRGGDFFVGRVRNLTSISWGRKLNEVSEATVSFALNGEDGDCCGLAASVNPWEHELSVTRDGEELWCGPIVGGEIDDASLTATFNAKDLSTWFDHRWVEVYDTDVDFDEADIIEVLNWLIGHGYYKDPWNMNWFLGDPLNIPITRTYTAYIPPGERWGGNYPKIADEIRDLLKARVDYTVIRRVMLGGDLQSSTVATARFTDSSWITKPKTIIVGLGMAEEVGVGGGNGGYYGWDDDQMWIERPYDAERVKYGLLQSFVPAPEIDDVDTYTLPNAVTQRAAELRELKKKPFIYVSGGALAQDAPVTFDQLIPGRHFGINLAKTCRPIQSDYVLTAVNVDFSDEGESIAVELVPPGLESLKG